MRMRKISSEDWEKMEAGIQCSKEKNSMKLLEILKKVQEERKKNSSNIDPIINKEIRPAGRRSFFLKEWENHLHRKLTSLVSIHLGLPYMRENKTLGKMEIKDKIINIQINLGMDSEMEDLLINHYGTCKDDKQKKKVYDIMFLHFALGLNCLRPQTGKNNHKLKFNKPGNERIPKKSRQIVTHLTINPTSKKRVKAKAKINWGKPPKFAKSKLFINMYNEYTLY